MLPLYMFCHPAVVAIGLLIVQSHVGILPQLIVGALGASAVTLGPTDMIRRIGSLCVLFGMKTGGREAGRASRLQQMTTSGGGRSPPLDGFLLELPPKPSPSKASEIYPDCTDYLDPDPRLRGNRCSGDRFWYRKNARCVR